MGTTGLAERRWSPLLADPVLQAQVERVGFAVAGPLLGPAEVAELLRRHRQLGDVLDPVCAAHWYTSGALAEPRARRAVYESVGEVLRPALAGVVAEGAVALAGNLHVNPPHSTSGLGPHQDIALVDERQASSINGWVALVDITPENGPLHFVPGSHRFGNPDRSLAVPWAYDGLHDLFWEFAVPVVVPAGHLVLFDTAMVHCSTPNVTAQPRIAANCLVVPGLGQLRHLVAAPGAGTVELFDVDVDFLIEGDLTGPPGPGLGRPAGARELHRPPTAEVEVRAQCRAGAGLLER